MRYSELKCDSGTDNAIGILFLLGIGDVYVDLTSVVTMGEGRVS